MVKNLLNLPELSTNNFRTHMSHARIDDLYDVQQSYEISKKPKGFWYSFGDGWVRWCMDRMPEWVGKHVYTVDISELNILKIQSHKDFEEFNSKYFINNGGWNMGIQWSTVALEYDGIEFATKDGYYISSPYGHVYSKDNPYLWYDGYDVSSGCIWNAKKIKIKKVEEPKGIFLHLKRCLPEARLINLKVKIDRILSEPDNSPYKKMFMRRYRKERKNCKRAICRRNAWISKNIK